MEERFSDSRAVNNDTRLEFGNRSNIDSKADYGGDLSKSEGVDLNDNAGGAYDIANTKATEEIGKDLNEGNNEQLDALLDNFKEDKWGDLSLDEQKQSITDLADFVAADTGNENPPEIVFRDDMEDGTYGGYSPDSNIIEINVNMLYDSYEAADTISHEMWHAYQEQAAKDPNNPRAAEYQEGFDNYITPDLDFEGYENQMVEVEARAYAQGFKDRLNVLKGAA